MSRGIEGLESVSIVYAEDHPQHRQLWGRRLQDFFPKVLLAGDGAEAFQQRRGWEGSSLCLVDLEMPGKSGEEPSKDAGLNLIARLKEVPGTIVVVLSAWADDEAIRHAAEARGADRVFTKDVKPRELIAELQSLVASLVPVRRSTRPGVIEPTSPELLRQVREQQEWLGRAENLETYAGQVVAIYRGEVWGHGPDHAAALGALREKLKEQAGGPGLPAPEDVSYVVVPDWVTPERPLPTY